ncbi:MAG: glycosyltransferase family 2 protein [Acidimicrobiales bacterium]
MSGSEWERHRIDATVVVPTFNGAEAIPGLLEALASQTMPLDRFEVIIVDDCSTDRTAAVVDELAKTSPLALRLCRTAACGGPAGARNLGWVQARSDVVAYLDDDCMPAPEWLESGWRHMAGDPGLGVVQGRTTVPEGCDIWRLTDWYVWRVVEGPSPYFEACNIFYRRAALEQSGGFDEVHGWWGEDTAAGWAVLEQGWGRGFAADAEVTHVVERRGWWWFVDNGWREKNCIRLAAKYSGFREEAFWRPWAFRREDPAFLLAILGAVASFRWKPAAIAALPYLWWRRPSIRQRTFLRLALQVPVVDAARCLGQLHGAVKYRILAV